ncbi:MAG: hypothetical protein RR356_00165 [Bacteroidales bacterium]
MQVIIYIVGTLFTSLVVFLTSFFSIKFFLENDQKKRLLELKHNAKSVITPLRLQAYERMAMFLERMEPNQLILRVGNAEFDALQLRTLLLTSIRTEFEHNLSQQIYISSEAWNQVCIAKEEMVQIINLSAGKLEVDASGLDLITAILEQTANKSPVSKAMEILKEEIRLLF